MDFERIIQLFEEAEYEPRSYSGRYMYGDKCLGVDCESPIVAILSVIDLASDIDEVRALVDIFKGAKTDNMGRDEIVYFPNVSWEEVKAD